MTKSGDHQSHSTVERRCVMPVSLPMGLLKELVHDKKEDFLFKGNVLCVCMFVKHCTPKSYSVLDIEKGDMTLTLPPFLCLERYEEREGKALVLEGALPHSQVLTLQDNFQ